MSGTLEALLIIGGFVVIALILRAVQRVMLRGARATNRNPDTDETNQL